MHPHPAITSSCAASSARWAASSAADSKFHSHHERRGCSGPAPPRGRDTSPTTLLRSFAHLAIARGLYALTQLSGNALRSAPKHLASLHTRIDGPELWEAKYGVHGVSNDFKQPTHCFPGQRSTALAKRVIRAGSSSLSTRRCGPMARADPYKTVADLKAARGRCAGSSAPWPHIEQLTEQPAGISLSNAREPSQSWLDARSSRPTAMSCLSGCPSGIDAAVIWFSPSLVQLRLLSACYRAKLDVSAAAEVP